MAMTWGAWLVGVAYMALFQGSIDSRPDAFFIIILHAGIVSISLFAGRSRLEAVILGIGLWMRIGLVMMDIHLRPDVQLLHSGGDSEMYFASALNVSDDPSLLLEDIYGGVYSKSVGLLFWLIGPSREFAQYTNVLLSLSAGLILIRLIRSLKVSDSVAVRVLAVFMFLPNSMIISSLFLREAPILFLLTTSLMFFCRWMENGQLHSSLLAVGFLFLASAFHAGVIAGLVAYAAAFVFFRPRIQRYTFSLSSLPVLALLVAIVVVAALQFPDIFFGKFDKMDGVQDVVTSTNRRAGGSAYLTGLVVEGWGDLFLLGPLRMVYFLGSPLPWDWSGLADIFAFVLDGAVFAGIPVYLYRNRHSLGEQRALVLTILGFVLVSSFLFGAGVSNAGTAIRHRNKMLAYFAVMVAVAFDRRRSAGSVSRDEGAP